MDPNTLSGRRVRSGTENNTVYTEQIKFYMFTTPAPDITKFEVMTSFSP
jgi:hypothetical protein